MTVNTNGDGAPTNAQVAARPPARFTAQIVIMEEEYVRRRLDAIAERYGLSRSDLARRALRAGLPTVAIELDVEQLRLETAGAGE